MQSPARNILKQIYRLRWYKKGWPNCRPKERNQSLTRPSTQNWRPNYNSCHKKKKKKKKIILSPLLQKSRWLNHKPSREISNPFPASVFILKGDQTAKMNHNSGEDSNTFIWKRIFSCFLQISCQMKQLYHVDDRLKKYDYGRWQNDPDKRKPNNSEKKKSFPSAI